MTDTFTSCEVGLEQLVDRLGKNHPRYPEALKLSEQLRENIRQVRAQGDDSSRQSERKRVLRQLNRLALGTLGAGFRESGFGEPPSLITQIILNLISLVILSVVILLSGDADVVLEHLWPCKPVWVKALSVACIILPLGHLLWRYLIPVLEDILLTPKLDLLVTLGDALHPWRLSNRTLPVAATIVIITGAIILFGPWFRIPETLPIIQYFSVGYTDTHTETFAAGDLVEIPARTQVLVEAVVSDQEVLCTWSAMKGTNLPVTGCATLYSPPLGEEYDVLNVLVQSPCKTWQKFADLHIKVVQAQP